MNENATPLAAEIAFYEANHADLFAKYPLKFVVIKDSAFVAAFDTLDAAYTYGVSTFKLEPFLVRQVFQNEPVMQSPALYTGLVSLHG